MKHNTSIATLTIIALAAIVSLLVGPRPAEACEVVHQNRILPLGSKQGSVWFLELSLIRDRAPDLKHKKGLYWRGKSWLRSADKHGALLPKKHFLAKVFVRTTMYKRVLQQLIKKARKQLKLQRSPRNMRFTYCHFKKTCRGYGLAPTRQGAVLRRQKSRSILARYDRKSLKQLANHHNFRLSAFNRLTSLRTFWIGRHKFALFQLSKGGIGGPWRQGFYIKNHFCRKAIHCIPDPLVMHHGKSIDLLVKLSP